MGHTVTRITAICKGVDGFKSDHKYEFEMLVGRGGRIELHFEGTYRFYSGLHKLLQHWSHITSVGEPKFINTLPERSRIKL